MLPALLLVAPPTARFAFARARLARDAWVPAYKLSSGRLWWRCLRLSCSRGELHPCAERLAKHLSWHLGDRVTLTDVRAVLGGYASYHDLSMRTAWTDWGRLVAAGWLAPTRAPANQGRGYPQGPGSGRAARYVLTAPAAMITQLRARVRRRPVTSLDTFSSKEGSPSPSVPPHRQDQQRGWITLRRPNPTERREASALLAGCHEPWRRQRPDSKLLTRPDWHRLLPLVAQVQAQRPDVALPAVLTDRIRSARCLPGVLAWRLWQLLRQPRPQPPAPAQSPQHPTASAHPTTVADPENWHQHRDAVHTLGGPAAARAALAAAGERANDHQSTNQSAKQSTSQQADQPANRTETDCNNQQRAIKHPQPRLHSSSCNILPIDFST